MRINNSIKSAATTVALVFIITACSSNDEPLSEISSFEYQLSCLETAGNPEAELQDMIGLDAAYAAAFGMENGMFKLSGAAESVMSELNRKTEKVEASFIGYMWSGTYKVELIKRPSGEKLYDYTYHSAAENLRHPDMQPASKSYAYTLTQLSSNGSNADKSKINDKYYSVFNINSGRFIIYNDDPDAVLNEKGREIQSTFSDTSWDGKYKVEIKDCVYNSICYTYTFE